MPTWSGAESYTRARAFWWRTAIVTVLATAVLAMHALGGGAAAGEDHSDMAHAMSGSATSPVTAVTIEHGSDRSDDSHAIIHCRAGGLCLSLVALGMLLLVASRAGRPLVARRRDSIEPTLRLLLSRARVPDPTNLHSLSILRC